MPQVNDHESDGRQQNKTCKIDQNNAGNLPGLITIGSNQEAHFRQNLFDSNYSKEDGYDIYQIFNYSRMHFINNCLNDE